jgi:hypothetical protein
LLNFIDHFSQNPGLLAVGATPVPDVVYNNRNDLLPKIYRANHGISQLLQTNSLSGMCYGIRFDILNKIQFPQIQLAEDMFVSARLDGNFIRDPAIEIIFKTPKSIKTEINRRARQEISTQRYRDYYCFIKQKEGAVKLSNDSLGSRYRWGIKQSSLIKAWFQLKSLELKLYAIGYLSIHLIAKVKARRKLREVQMSFTEDYWTVVR